MYDTGSYYDELAIRTIHTRPRLICRIKSAYISVGNKLHVVYKLECCPQLGVTGRN